MEKEKHSKFKKVEIGMYVMMKDGHACLVEISGAQSSFPKDKVHFKCDEAGLNQDFLAEDIAGVILELPRFIKTFCKK